MIRSFLIIGQKLLVAAANQSQYILSVSLRGEVFDKDGVVGGGLHVEVGAELSFAEAVDDHLVDDGPESSHDKDKGVLGFEIDLIVKFVGNAEQTQEILPTCFSAGRTAVAEEVGEKSVDGDNSQEKEEKN